MGKVGRPARTVAEKAAAEGISVSTYYRRLKKEPAKKEAPEDTNWKRRRERAQALKEEKILEVLDGEYVPRGTVEDEQAKIAFVLNAFVRAVETELPPLVAGLTPAKVEKAVKKWTPGWVAKLRNAQSNVWQAAAQELVRTLRGDMKKVAQAKARRK